MKKSVTVESYLSDMEFFIGESRNPDLPDETRKYKMVLAYRLAIKALCLAEHTGQDTRWLERLDSAFRTVLNEAFGSFSADEMNRSWDYFKPRK